MAKQVQQLDRVVIRFAGDSGDGMQLAGDQFTNETAVFGNDLSTLPNFPAEIRAPAGTLPGVSSFQLHFADHEITTPGDAPDVLVAMNPAALKANLSDLPTGRDIIVNTDEFSARNLAKVGYGSSPLDGGELASWRVHKVPLTSMTVEALKDTGLGEEGRRAGQEHVRARPAVLDVQPDPPTSTIQLPAGEVRPQARRSPPPTWPRSGPATTTATPPRRSRSPTRWQAGPAAGRARYRNISGNPALAYGLVAASVQRSGLPLFLGAYPITPASDILHELARHKRVRRADVPGRGRDRRHRRGARRGVRRRARRHHLLRPGHRAEVGDHRAWPCRWSCRW